MKQCSTEACPNLCHEYCLGQETEYKCGSTSKIRFRARIYDQVTFESSDTPATSHPVTVFEECSEDDLSHLTKEELVELVKDLCVELASTKKKLYIHESIVNTIRDKRSVLVDVLKVTDALIDSRKIEEQGVVSAAADQFPDESNSPPLNPSQTSSLSLAVGERDIPPASREITVSNTSDNSEAEKQHRPLQGNPQITKASGRRRRRKRTERSGNKTPESEAALEARR